MSKSPDFANLFLQKEMFRGIEKGQNMAFQEDAMTQRFARKRVLKVWR